MTSSMSAWKLVLDCSEVRNNGAKKTVEIEIQRPAQFTTQKERE